MARNPRVRIARPISATFVSGSSRGSGHLYDLSNGGLFVRSAMLLKKGSKVSATLQIGSGGCLNVDGVVQWNTASVAGRKMEPGFGVRVTRSRSEYLAFVEGALAATPSDGGPWTHYAG